MYYTKKPTKYVGFFNKSGWQDSNLRPPRPKRGAITGLRYTPNNKIANIYIRHY